MHYGACRNYQSFISLHFRVWPTSVYANKICHRSLSHGRLGPSRAPGLRHRYQTGLTALSACHVGAHLHDLSPRHLVVDVELWGRVVRSFFLFGKWNSFQGKITQSLHWKLSPNGHIICYCSALSSRSGHEHVSRFLAEFSALFGAKIAMSKGSKWTRSTRILVKATRFGWDTHSVFCAL